MIFAHTLLSKFELCPRQFQHAYVLKDLPREPPSQALKDGRDAHQAFEHRLKDGTPLPEPWRGFEGYCLSVQGHKPLVELSLGITLSGEPSGFWDEKTWLRGKLDVALPTENAVILDWKTGKRREEPDELEIFGLLLKANFPLVKQVKGYYVWLKEGRVGQMHDLSSSEEKLAQLRQRTGRVEAALKAQFFPPIENPLCAWCPVKSCQFNKRRD